jgi:hypothetical protein
MSGFLRRNVSFFFCAPEILGTLRGPRALHWTASHSARKDFNERVGDGILRLGVRQPFPRPLIKLNIGYAGLMMTKKSLKKGDKVRWNASQGAVTGRVVGKQTSATKIEGHKVAASKSKPQFIVESDKTGKRAAHKKDALEKKS